MTADTHLLHRYHLHGDATAFAELVQAHSGMVFATAQRVTRDAMLAEEVAQDAFLSLAKSGHQTIQSVAAWLHHVAYQRACDAVRREITRQCHEPAAEHWHEAAEATWEEIEPVVDEVLAELPEKVRTLLIEHFLEQRTQADLAARHSVSQSTISRQIENGVQDIRSRLRKRGVVCGIGLAGLLMANSVQAAPAALNASLWKIGVSGIGVGKITTAGTLGTIFTSMTTTTKILGTAAFIAIAASLPFVLNEPPPVLAKPVAQAPVAKPPQPKATPKSPTASWSAATPKRYRPQPVSEVVQWKADDLIRRLGGKTLEELANNAEIKQISERFGALLAHSETQQKIKERLETLKAVTGTQHGTLSMSDERIDTPFGRAVIEAALANDRQYAEEIILNRLDGATFEFALSPGTRTSSDGVTIQPTPAKPKIAPQED